MRRGDIFLANVKQEAGMKKTRMVLVIQNDIGNKYANHSIVAVIRHDTGKSLRVHVSVPSGEAGLTQDSVVDCGRIATIDKVRLGKHIGRLSREYQARIDEALKISLALS